MKYLLVVITHGNSETLPAALQAFHEHALPRAVGESIHHDLRSEGFCVNTRRAWLEASQSDCDYVFWLEHDFLLTREIDLTQLADVLDANRRLAQMQLMRNAVSAPEKAAGGLFESRPGQYLSHEGWLEHRSYLTTNPSLMRREFMLEHPWPDHRAQCEGLFGIDLVARGYSFGVWGDGQPWCEHIGVRTGHGY